MRLPKRIVTICSTLLLTLSYGHLYANKADYGYGSERLLYKSDPIFNGVYYLKFTGAYTMALQETESLDKDEFPVEESWENLNSYAITGELGYTFDPNYDGIPATIIALTTIYRPQKKFTMDATNGRAGTAKVETIQPMLTLYYDFCHDCEGSAYIGASAGLAIHNTTFAYYTNAKRTSLLNQDTKTEVGFAGALTLGAAVPLMDLRNGSSIDLDAFARYNWLGTVNYKGVNGNVFRGQPYHAFDFGLGLIIPLTFT